MKKLLIVLALCVFAISCCEVDHNNSQKSKKVTATSFKVYSENGGYVCRCYEFMYHGHKYITNYGGKFLLHSPECSCQY